MFTPLTPDVLSLGTYLDGRWLCFDLETTNADKGSALNKSNRIVMVAWQERGGKVQHHYGNPLDAAEFWQAVERADFLVAHNAKFEAHWLWSLGYDPTQKVWYDTLLGEYVRYGNNPRRRRLDLGSTAARYREDTKDPLIDAMMKAGICPSDQPRQRLIARACRDVRTTANIMRKQRSWLHKRGLLKVLLTRCLLTPVLVDIERCGMCLDVARVREEYDKYCAAHAALAQEFAEFTGGINPRSPDQMAHYLYGGGQLPDPDDPEKLVDNPAPSLKFPERRNAWKKPLRNKPSKQFPDGRPKTDKLTLEWLKTKARTKRQKQFIALRERLGQLDAALTKNLEFFKGVVEETDDAVFYGEFRQSTTGTHRLSGGGRRINFVMFRSGKSVQFQNMPRIFKRLFRARDEDWQIEEADGAQLEFRVAAFLGQDRQAIADIRNPDFDAHIQSAAAIHDEPYDTVYSIYRDKSHARYTEVKAWRQGAKQHTFKPLYGGEKGSAAEERYYRVFRERYSELHEMQNLWLSEVEATGELVTDWGLRFYWDTYENAAGVVFDKAKHKPIKPSVFNYPVQSLATAEIIPIAIICLYYRCRRQGLRVRFVNTVHDSIIAEVHRDDHLAYRRNVVQAFGADVYRYLHRVYGVQFNVPLGVEIKAGSHWSEGEEFSTDVEPPEYRIAA